MDLYSLRLPKSRFGLRSQESTPRLLHLWTYNRRLQKLPPRERSITVRSNPIEQINQTLKKERQLESTKVPADIRQKVESAIELQGNRVTVGDVSSKAGVSLNEAEDALQALAADALGTIEVSNDGEVVYVLPRDFRNQIRSKSFMLQMEPRMKALTSSLAWLARVSFGLVFITSVIAVWVAIAVIASSGDSDSRNSRSSSRGSGMMMVNILDTFRWMTIMDNMQSYDDYDKERGRNRMNFMEAVFSYMFGDGDPNQDLEDRRWNVVGNYIRSKGGVVAAEELAPFLDLTKDALDNDEALVVDEGYMLPVLTRFNGEALVNEQGQLLYVFPQLQTTGIARILPQRPVQIPYVQENRWKFSKAGAGQLGMVIFFAAANIIGVNILSGLIYENLAVNAIVVPALPVVLGLLSIYAWSFVIVPIMRWFINRSRNKAIDNRNALRALSASKIDSPPTPLRAKLESARTLSKRKFVARQDVIYSSSKDTDEQVKRMEEEDFDRRLNEIGQ